MYLLRLKKMILFSGFLLSISCSEVTIAPTGEIPDPTHPEIATMRADPHWGTAVIYNPDICKEIGDACGFFRLHAFAHAVLNHTLLASPASYPVSIESQADCWAAKYGKPHEIHAAVQLFLQEDSSSKWKIYGNLIQRAQTVRRCAKHAGKILAIGQ